MTGFFFGEAEAMPLPPPAVTGAGAEAGMAASASGASGKFNQEAAQALSHRMKHLSGPDVFAGRIAMDQPFVVMGAILQSMLRGEKSDLLTAEKLLEVAAQKGTVATRVRYHWEEDPDSGSLKAVGYHTGPDSGRDQVKVRLLERSISGSYQFWDEGHGDKPLITWTPADAPGSSDAGGWHTGNESGQAGTVTIPGLEYPDTNDIRVTPSPAPEEKNFRDYILVFPGNVFPPIYIYLSKNPEDPIWTKTSTLEAVKNAYDHWVKHGREFTERTFKNAKEYVDATHDFVRKPSRGTLTKTRVNGDVLFYHPETNTFSAKTKNGIPKTMFKPKDGMGYWEKQK